MILITGGTGFLGAHLLEALTRKGEQVRAIKRSSGSPDFVQRVFRLYAADAEQQFSRIEWVEADLLNIFSLENALEGITQLYHCAGEVAFVKKQRAALMQANAKGTTNLVNLCLENGNIRFCHVSSIAAIGRSRLEDSIGEERFWKNDPNNSWYAITKYNAEREVWRAIEEGLNAVIVNPSVILGYSPWNEGTGRLFARVDNGLKYYTEGITGWVDVKDVVKAMIFLMESGISSERYILSAENRSYKEIFDCMADALQKPRPSSKAGPFLSAVAWRMEKLRTALTGKDPVITKETARTAQLKCFYENKKILQLMPELFTPVNDTIKQTAAQYRTENP